MVNTAGSRAAGCSVARRILPLLGLVIAMGCEGGSLRGDGGASSVSNGDGSVAGAAFNAEVAPIRHLLVRELINAYSDLLGSSAAAAVDQSALLTDGLVGTYDNDASAQSMSQDRLEGFMNAAAQAANEALGNPRRVASTLGCAQTAINEACVKTFVQSFGRRAYRRPLSDEEVADYMTLFASESMPLNGANLVLRAILSAPDFLYQPEIGAPYSQRAGFSRLTGYEIATKLSLLLLGTTPSETLLDDAESGKFDSAEAVGETAAEMLQDPRAKAYLRNFAINWLGINDGLKSGTGLTAFANDSTQARKDMPEETLRLFDDYASPGQHLSDMYIANYTYISPALAPIYGFAAPAPNTWAKVDLAGKPRLGFLTHANLLNMTGIATYPAIKRGKYVIEHLLCGTLGQPPAAAAGVVLSADAQGGTERQKLDAHLADPGCKSCHVQMDPLGFIFEQYDGVGNFAPVDNKGRALTGLGELTEESTVQVTGVVDLAQNLAKSETVKQCIAKKLGQYLLGRTTRIGDVAMLNALDTDLRDKDLQTAIVDFVQSDAFLLRKR